MPVQDQLAETDLETAYRICPFCEATCGLELQVDRQNRKLVSVRGNDKDVFSSGFVCPKAVALKDLDQDPDRLRTPMIRRGGNLEPASWDEAFAEIKRCTLPIIAEHGRHALGLYVGNPTAHKAGLSMAFQVFARALATPNMFSASTLDQIPRHLTVGLLYGSWMSVPVPDIDHTDLLVVVGGNPLVSNGSMWTVPNFRGRLAAMKARGGRLITVDPKRTKTAKASDHYLSIKPGTDVFLFLALIHTLFDEGLTRPGKLESLIEDVDALEESVKGFSPERVAAITQVPADEIRKLARDLSETTRAALYCRMGASVTEFGTTANWAVEAFNILAGNLDREGGVMFPKAAGFQFNASGPGGSGKGVRKGRRKSRVRGAPELMGEFPAVCLSEEIETPGEGQIRALFTVAGNPALSAPDGQRLARALDTLDFMVSTDIYLNETTRHADVVLPGVSPLEELHFPFSFQQLSTRNVARFSDPLFEVDEGQMPEWQIMYKLALIVSGQDEAVSVEAMDEMILTGRVNSALGSRPELEGKTPEELLKALGNAPGPTRMIDLELRTGPYGDLFGAHPDGLSLEKLRAHPEGVDLGALTPRLPEVLRTKTGTIPLFPQEIADDLARVTAELVAQEASSGDGKLLMIGRRHLRTNNSWMHNLPTLAKGKFKGALEINPEDARARGLTDGDTARISNAQGEVEVTVELTDDISPGTVTLPHGFGHVFDDTNMGVAQANPGVNSNLLADGNRIDPLSGNAHLNAIEVDVTALIPTA